MAQHLHISLGARVASVFERSVRDRGQAYFRQRAVKNLRGDGERARAHVVGSSLYKVSLSYDRTTGKLLAACDCPYFFDRGPCKHIWATLMAAETGGLLRTAEGDSRLQLHADIEAEAVFEGESVSAPPDDGEDDEDSTPAFDPILPPPAGLAKRRTGKPKRLTTPNWHKQLDELEHHRPLDPYEAPATWPAHRQIVYVIDTSRSQAARGVVVEVAYRQIKRNGEWSKLKSQRIDRVMVGQLPDPVDRRVLALLYGSPEDDGYVYDSFTGDYAAGRYALAPAAQAVLVRMMCQSGRCVLRLDEELHDRPPVEPLAWDEAGAWELRLAAAELENGSVEVTGALRRGEDQRALDAPTLVVPGMVFMDGAAAELRDGGGFAWFTLLREQEKIAVPQADREPFLERLLRQASLPPLDLPASLHVETVTGAPRFHLRVRRPEDGVLDPSQEMLRARLDFEYEGTTIRLGSAERGVYRPEGRKFTARDGAQEAAAIALLHRLGFREAAAYERHGGETFEIPARHLASAVIELTRAGWMVQADGKVYRSGGQSRVHVTSGVDWFELSGAIQFGTQRAELPELLAAVRRGEETVLLDDGTYGILPTKWLEAYAPIIDMGTEEDGNLRFNRSQVVLLDALLAGQEEVTSDEAFAEARRQLRSFEGVHAADEPATFVGSLRPYQREGLGWLGFLRQFGFGGCLADDMGLGKTVQVLAMLETRRVLREEKTGADRPPPSLVVVPRSLVFNWMQEAARFTPRLRVLDHTTAARAKTTEQFDDYDLLLATYGTMRQDAPVLKDFRFDYAILDESQAIKNPDTASAKAARLLKADHRLALSGTPVENHLGELWSLLEFLNPGVRGHASLSRLATAAPDDQPTRQLLARAVRPLILRRTKAQVAPELPEKTEQTIYCELEGEQRRLYDELRDHYRQSLLPAAARGDLNRSKLLVLEALLRLRQAACHPGLIDPARVGEPSAKLDALLPQIAEVIDEGHKVLVFSQFTSLLAIVRSRLDATPELSTYEYIDGQTRDRAPRVQRFQEDPTCKLMLVSLKAGGLGLNLTAADYVFLLDPWWNPAVEAQAIDRAHRIGQTRHVFAYRLIARGTVEEKVLELQDSKRQLADAIINADNSLIRSLDSETLDALLS